VRKGQGDSELPAREGEGFLHYLHRLAQHQGYLQADAPLPQELTRRKRDKRSFLEKLDSIFARPRRPGEDVEPVGKEG
jgi:hypothetical protein